MEKDIVLKTKSILEKIGLNKNQIKFYLACLELGQADLTDIIKKSELKISTAYRIEEELKNMRLIQGDFKKYDQRLSVVSPNRILALASNKQRKMRRLELEIEELIPELNAVFQDRVVKPKVELYDNEQGYIYLGNQVLDCQEKVLYFLGNLADIYKVTGKDYEFKHFIPTRLKKEIRMNLLVYKNKDSLAFKKKDKGQLRETRFLDPNYKINASFEVFDNTVIFFSSHKEKIALSITSPYLAEMHKNIFKMVWDGVK